MTPARQQQPLDEYLLSMKIQIPQGMKPGGIEGYIKDYIFVKGWGEPFESNYIHVEDFKFSPSHTSAPSPEPDGGCPYWDLKVNEDPYDPENHCSCNFSVIKAEAAKAAREQFADEAITKITLELNDTDRKWKGMMRSIEIIDSLRHQPEPQQEGRR